MSTPQDEIREMLSRIKLFSELSEPELAQIASIAQRRRTKSSCARETSTATCTTS